jgi:hypothetical protein
MKTILKVYSLLLLLSVTGTKVFAGDEPQVEKKKTYTKSYPVSSSDKISFNNQFGELRINTWDKNEVKVDVTITAKANSDERAQAILDQIEIKDWKSGNGVYFETKMDENRKNRSGGDKRNEGFSINYVVNMPARNPLSASNSFGDLIISDFGGEADIESKFGSLTAGNLSNVKSVDVEFGRGIIESLNNGKLTVKFSQALVKKMSGSVKAEFEHSGDIKLGIDNNIKGLTIKNSFSTLYLDVSKSLSASFDISTNFGDFDNRSDFNIKKEGEDEDQHGPVFDHKYSGKSGSGNVAMKIRSEFGQIVVGHNLPMNLEDKKEEKKRTRSI